MSSTAYLILALGATFGAVLVGAVAAQVGLAQRRRATELLERQVAPLRQTLLREDDLSRPFSSRIVAPVGAALGRLAKRLTPADVRRRIGRKLVLAGNPAGWDADKVAVMRAVGFVGGIAFGVVLSRAAQTSPATSVFLVVLVTGIGFSAPGVILSSMVSKRQDEIRRALPDAMDLLTISVEAGLGFEAALLHVAKNVPGALSQEIGRMLHEMQLGVGRVEAFRHLADRTDVEDLKGFVLAMIQADVFGVSISKVLRSQAKELRMRRRQRAEHKAMQTPVKLLFPMILCVLPALFVVIVGPGALQIVGAFFGSGL